MQLSTLRTCIAGSMIFMGACTAQAAFRDGRVRTCPLPDGASFVLTAHAPNLGKHDVFGSGRNRDAFAAAFSVTYRGKESRGEELVTTLTGFNDDHPDCANYGMSESTLYALSDKAIFRFMAANGKRGGALLVVSHDGGLSFSDNIHPNAREKAQANQAILDAFDRFGYHRSRFRSVGGQYQLEITNPLDYKDFLLFVSADGGQAWSGPARSQEPTVFPGAEVEKWRTHFARHAWLNKVFAAKSAACKPVLLAGCASATEDYWEARWQACLAQHDARECLAILPDPTARLAPGEAGN
jgi:hypothetical protein